MAKSEGRKIKGGKPIYRQEAARQRKASQLSAYWRRLKKRKYARVKSSNGLVFAEAWAKKYLYV